MSKRQTLSKLARTEERYFYLFIAPWVIGFVIFTLGPIIASLFLGFTFYDIVSSMRWVGFDNYEYMLTDFMFWQALKVTFQYAAGSVILRIIAAFSIAIILNRNIFGLSVYRTIFYLPSVISGVAVSLLWMWIFNPNYGVLNSILWKLFRIDGPGWIYSEEWVIPSMILMSLWGIGGGIVIYLARLQAIPTPLYESAEIDGANGFRKLLHITIPMMTPVIFFNLIMGIIGSFQSFTYAYVMTEGGPHYASLFYVLYLYRNAFRYYKMGYASALAWILFIVILSLTLLVFRTSSRWVYYESA